MPRGSVFCAFAVIGAALLSGCSYTTAIPVEPGSRVSGIRVYDVKPILIVTRDSYKVEMVPNYNRAYALRFGAFLAKNDTNVTMANGMVSAVDVKLDSTAALKLLELAAGKILPQAGQATSGNSQDGVVFAVYEFRFDDAGELIGLLQVPLGQYPPPVPVAAASTGGPPVPEQN